MDVISPLLNMFQRFLKIFATNMKSDDTSVVFATLEVSLKRSFHLLIPRSPKVLEQYFDWLRRR